MEILRDTNCACKIVNNKIPKKESLINEYSLLKMADKNVYKAQKSIIEIKLPYYTGKTEALSFDPEHDLIISHSK